MRFAGDEKERTLQSQRCARGNSEFGLGSGHKKAVRVLNTLERETNSLVGNALSANDCKRHLRAHLDVNRDGLLPLGSEGVVRVSWIQSLSVVRDLHDQDWR